MLFWLMVSKSHIMYLFGNAAHFINLQWVDATMAFLVQDTDFINILQSFPEEVGMVSYYSKLARLSNPM